MKQSNSFPRIAAAVLAFTCLFSVSALAVETNSTTSMRLEQESSVSSASSALQNCDSPIKVNPSDANSSYTVYYNDENGNVRTSTISAQDTNSYAYVSTGGSSLRVRQGPGTDYSILASAEDGTTFRITGKTGGWYQIACNGRVGYVSASYIKVQNANNVLTSPTPGSSDSSGTDLSTIGGQIVAYAKNFVGYPYIYATAGPDSFDCSGLTSYVYAHFGYTLNRSSKDQYKNGIEITDKSKLQPGDLVFFAQDNTTISHVGIYIGNNKLLHASTPTNGVIISDLTTNYYVSHYYGARRIIT